MRIAWDCRSISKHKGGIASATVGWLGAFATRCPADWAIVAVYSDLGDQLVFRNVVPSDRKWAIQEVKAGFIAPRFEQLQLPALLQQTRVELCVNPSFSIPAIKPTTRQIAVVHDVVFLNQPQWVEPRLRQYLTSATDRGWENADHVRSLPPAVVNEHREFARKSSFQASTPRLPDGVPADFILYLGSVEQKKGATFLLDAYKHFVDRRTAVPKLVLAGGVGGQPDDTHAQVRQRGLQDHVIIGGAVSNDTKCRLVANAKVFVFPSLYEGFGIPPLEAMCFGMPVVAARAAALPDVDRLFLAAGERLLKILHLSSEMPPQKVFDLGRFVRDLAEEQVRQGHEFVVLTNNHNGDLADTTVNGVRILRVDHPNPPKPAYMTGCVMIFNIMLLRRALDLGTNALREFDTICSHDCSCLRLAVASDRLRRGLAPPITHPCPAHLRLGAAPLACAPARPAIQSVATTPTLIAAGT